MDSPSPLTPRASPTATALAKSAAQLCSSLASGSGASLVSASLASNCSRALRLRGGRSVITRWSSAMGREDGGRRALDVLPRRAPVAHRDAHQRPTAPDRAREPAGAVVLHARNDLTGPVVAFLDG